MTRLLHIALLAIALLVLSTTACSDDSCYDNGSSLPLATFYVGSVQQAIPRLTIMGLGAPGDSLLADSTTLSEVYLPLRASVTSTSYKITRYVTTGGETTPLTDTLTIDYKPIEFFHSIECGAMYNFDISRVGCTSHGIDSVVLLIPLVTNSTAPALRIHFTDLAQ